MKYLERIKTAFKAAIGEAAVENVTPEATMEDVPGWDSTNFIDLVLAVEDEFDVELSTIDATSLTSIAAINSYLENKLG